MVYYPNIEAELVVIRNKAPSWITGGYSDCVSTMVLFQTCGLWLMW